jgi:hypothetical protein
MRPITKFKTGWCASDNHSHCRGALNNPGGRDKVWYCDCRCHRGKEVAPLEEPEERVLNPRIEQQKITDDWVGQCIIHGHIEIPVSDQKTATSIQGRIVRTANKGTVKITTRYVDGEVRCKVAPVRKSRAKKTKRVAKKK